MRKKKDRKAEIISAISILFCTINELIYYNNYLEFLLN